MPLQTFSDPGFVPHLAEGLGAAETVRGQRAQLEIERQQADTQRMRAENERARLAAGDMAARERAARNLGVAIDELEQAGIDPSVHNMADDAQFLAQHSPETLRSIGQTYTQPGQEMEASVALMRARRAVEKGQAQAAKKAGFDSWLQVNGPFLAQTEGADGKPAAENPLLEQLRSLAQDPNVSAEEFDLAKRRVTGQLQEQTRAQLSYQQDLADAQALWNQNPKLSRLERERALELMAQVQHGDNQKERRSALFELGVILSGGMEEWQEMLDENARNVAATMMAMSGQGGQAPGAPSRAALSPGHPSAGGASPPAAAPQGGGGAGATGLGPQPEAGSGQPKPDQKSAAAELYRWVEESRTAGRGLIHEPTLLLKAQELLGRPVTKDEVRDLLRTIRGKAPSKATAPTEPTKGKAPSMTQMWGAGLGRL